MKKLRVGVIGIGDISNVYLNNLKKYDAVEVVACASRGLEKAQRKAAEHDIPRHMPRMELIADPDIDIILNLTTPQAHYEYNLAALKAASMSTRRSRWRRRLSRAGNWFRLLRRRDC